MNEEKTCPVCGYKNKEREWHKIEATSTGEYPAFLELIKDRIGKGSIYIDVCPNCGICSVNRIKEQ